MPSITEDNLTFDFPTNWTAVKHDKLSFYRHQFQSTKVKAVDILAIDPQGRCWLIEIKDYRKGHQTSVAELAGVVAQKVRDTLAGPATARIRATGGDQQVALASMACSDFRVVLHMENQHLRSALFAQPISLVNVQQDLKRLVEVIDPQIQVVDVKGSAHLPWTVQDSS